MKRTDRWKYGNYAIQVTPTGKRLDRRGRDVSISRGARSDCRTAASERLVARSWEASDRFGDQRHVKAPVGLFFYFKKKNVDLHKVEFSRFVSGRLRCTGERFSNSYFKFLMRSVASCKSRLNCIIRWFRCLKRLTVNERWIVRSFDWNWHTTHRLLEPWFKFLNI